MTKLMAWNILPSLLNGIIKYPHRSDLVKALVDTLNILKPIKPDETTGLVPCGCGMAAKIVTHEHLRTFNGEKFIKYSVKCPKNHVSTDLFNTQLQAKNYWQRAMGGDTMKEQEETK